MTTIALLGAGGKMGTRLAANLKDAPYAVSHVEVSDEGRRRLADTLGIGCVDAAAAVPGADFIILAVPDRLIGKVAGHIIASVRPGSALIVLDAAAPYAGEMPPRADVTYFATHPCHPPLFSDEHDPAVRKDFFGGIAAKQAIVCALIQGPEGDYARCEELARQIFKPVMRSHRCTLEQMAILEPALSETVAATFCVALREATDRAVGMGVPRQAAMDFMLGHLNAELAIAFGVLPNGRFSDGCLHAIEQAQDVVFKAHWLDRVFSDEAIRKSVRDICNPAPRPQEASG